MQQSFAGEWEPSGPDPWQGGVRARPQAASGRKQQALLLDQSSAAAKRSPSEHRTIWSIRYATPPPKRNLVRSPTRIGPKAQAVMGLRALDRGHKAYYP